MNSIETTIQQQLPWCDDDPMVVGYFLCFLLAPISASSLSNLSPCFHGSIFLLSSVSHGRQCIHQITWNQIFHDLRQIATKIAIQLHHIWVNYNISLTWVVTYPDHITSIAFHVPRPQKTTSAGNPPMFLSDFWPASMSSTLDRKGEFLTNKNRGNKKKHQMFIKYSSNISWTMWNDMWNYVSFWKKWVIWIWTSWNRFSMFSALRLSSLGDRAKKPQHGIKGRQNVRTSLQLVLQTCKSRNRKLLQMAVHTLQLSYSRSMVAMENGPFIDHKNDDLPLMYRWFLMIYPMYRWFMMIYLLTMVISYSKT